MFVGNVARIGCFGLLNAPFLGEIHLPNWRGLTLAYARVRDGPLERWDITYNYVVTERKTNKQTKNSPSTCLQLSPTLHDRACLQQIKFLKRQSNIQVPFQVIWSPFDLLSVRRFFAFLVFLFTCERLDVCSNGMSKLASQCLRSS